MTIRLSGMTSGLDTDSLVSELVSAYRTKEEKYEKAQTKLGWTQSVWKSLNSKIYSFYTGISSMKYSSAYNLKKTAVSDSTKATITASNSAVNGTQSLNITSLAKSGYLTGGNLSTTSGAKATESTTLAELGYSGSDSGTVSLNGTDVTLSGSTTVSDALTKLKAAGVNASFDATNQRIFVSSKESGADNDFTLSPTDANGTAALKALGLYTGSTATTALNKKYASYIQDSNGTTLGASDAKAQLKTLLETYNSNSSIVSQTTTATANLNSASTYLTAKTTQSTVEGKLTDANKTLAKNLLGATNATDKFVGSDGTVYTKATDSEGNTYYNADGDTATKYYLTTNTDGSYTLSTNSSYKEGDEGGISVTDSVSYLKDKVGLTADEITNYKTAATTISSFNTAAAAETSTLTGDYATYSLASLKSAIDDGTMTASGISSALSTVKTAGDTAQASLTSNAALKTYASEYATATTDSDASTTTDSVIDSLYERATYASTALADTDYTASAVRVDGSDATIYLNGAKYTSSSNTFSVNGLSITAQATTTTDAEVAAGTADDDAISITTSTDSQGIYDKIKDFLSDYNTLINEMTTKYNATSATGYEPLTSTEKDAMTDTEVENWETKIKDSLLRRDSTLGGVMSSMVNSMAGQTTINGTNYSLASFGIQTLGYLNAETNEENAYHIYGDSDDDSTSAYTDKLMAAINSDPEAVTEFFQKTVGNLYDSISTKMGSTSLSSIYTVYNDKEMAQEYSDYTDTISTWEDKVSDMEDFYYKKFSAMESALTSLQSKSSALSSLLS